jgi:hypothetical protein
MAFSWPLSFECSTCPGYSQHPSLDVAYPEEQRALLLNLWDQQTMWTPLFTTVTGFVCYWLDTCCHCRPYLRCTQGQAPLGSLSLFGHDLGQSRLGVPGTTGSPRNLCGQHSSTTQTMEMHIKRVADKIKQVTTPLQLGQMVSVKSVLGWNSPFA